MPSCIFPLNGPARRFRGAVYELENPNRIWKIAVALRKKQGRSSGVYKNNRSTLARSIPVSFPLEMPLVRVSESDLERNGQFRRGYLRVYGRECVPRHTTKWSDEYYMCQAHYFHLSNKN